MNTGAFGAGIGLLPHGRQPRYGLGDPDDVVAPASVGDTSLAEQAYDLALRIGGAFMEATLPMREAVAGIHTGNDAVKQLGEVENEALAVTNRLITLHNAGALSMREYVAYDQYRHRLHDNQVNVMKAVRKTISDTLGTTISDQVMARIPYPGWLPPIRPETGPMPAVVIGSTGFGVIQIPPIAITIVLVLAALGLVLYFSSDIIDTLADTFITRTQGKAMEQLLAQRDAAMRACTANGQPLAQCAQAVEEAYPTAALTDFMDRVNKSDKGALFYLGVFAAIGAAATFAWFMWGKRRPAASVSGLPRRTRGKKRGLRGATRLASLRDRVPSRYGLEVSR